MNAPDLVIRPADKILRIAWATLPDGKHWLAYMRLERGAQEGRPPIWALVDLARPWIDEPWIGGKTLFETCGRLVLQELLSREQKVRACRYGLAQVGGVSLLTDSGTDLLRQIAAGAKLPPWLSVLVIEHAPASTA